MHDQYDEQSPKFKMSTTLQAPDWGSNPFLVTASHALGAIALKAVFESSPNPEETKERFVNTYMTHVRRVNDEGFTGTRAEHMRNPFSYLFNQRIPRHCFAAADADQKINDTEKYLRFMMGLPPAKHIEQSDPADQV